MDERNVPHSSTDSNLKGAKDALLSKVPVPESQIYGILEGVPVRDAAVNYEGRLIGIPASVLPRNEKGFPIFDLILLGLGEPQSCPYLHYIEALKAGHSSLQAIAYPSAARNATDLP